MSHIHSSSFEKFGTLDFSYGNKFGAPDSSTC
jgi:hypothetical protein